MQKKKAICGAFVSRVIHELFAGHHSYENQRRLNIIYRISILYVPKHEQNVHKIPTILKTFWKKANIFLHKSRDITQLKILEELNANALTQILLIF